MTEDRRNESSRELGDSADERPAEGEASPAAGVPAGTDQVGLVPTGVLLAWLVLQNLWAFRRRRGSITSRPHGARGDG